MEWTSLYQPQPHQVRAHQLPHLEVLFLGGIGSGKTLWALHEMVFAAQDNPGCDGCIVAPTYPMLRDVVLPAVEQWLHPSLWTHRKSDQIITWHPTGARWFLRSAMEPGRISGLNLGYAWFDESALVPTAKAYRILLGRVRDPRATRRRLVTATTPAGFNWLVRHFRQPGNKAVIRAKTSDNKRLPDDFERALRVAYGPEYAAQYLDAEVLELAGLAWPIVPGVHCPEHFTDGWARRRCRFFFGSVDWGHAAPAALLVGGIDHDGRWYIVDGWYKRGQLREEIARAAKRLQLKWGCDRWFCDHDPEGEQHLRRPEVFHGENLPGLAVTLADKDVIPGVQYVRTLLPVRLDREPRLYVSPTACPDLLRENEGYFYPETKGAQIQPTEVPVGANGDHALDALRYLTYTHHTSYAGRVDFSNLAPPERMGRDWRGYR